MKQLFTLALLAFSLAAAAQSRDTVPAFEMKYDTLRVDTVVDLSNRIPKEYIIITLQPYVLLPEGASLKMKYQEVRRQPMLVKKD